MQPEDDIVAQLRNAKWTDDEVFGEAADEIERLRDELAAEWERNEDLTTAYMVAFEKGKDAIRAERDALRAGILEELAKALEPFVVPRDASHSGALYDESVVFEIDGHELKVGDFRRARAVYEKIKGGGGE